jgi:hypothetical protein
MQSGWDHCENVTKAEQTLRKIIADPARSPWRAFALLLYSVSCLRDGYSMPQKFDFVNSPQRGEFPAHQDDTRVG